MIPSEKAVELSPIKRALLAVEQMKDKLDALERARSEPIAIVGIGCRFPGAAGPEAFWRSAASRRGRRSARCRADRWDIDAYYDPDPDAPGKMYTRRAGFLDRVDGFDPQFFGISPREAAGMDPQQRLLLEVCWEALEHAGQAPDRLRRSQTGVFVGIVATDYATLQIEAGRSDAARRLLAVGPRAQHRLGPGVVRARAAGSEHVARHGVLVVAGGGAPGVPEPAPRRVPDGAGRRRQPDSAARQQRLLLARAHAGAGRPLQDVRRCGRRLRRGEGCGVVVLKRLVGRRRRRGSRPRA